MKAKGTVHKFGNNIDTDVIIPARYLNKSDEAWLASHCMEDIDKDFVCLSQILLEASLCVFLQRFQLVCICVKQGGQGLGGGFCQRIVGLRAGAAAQRPQSFR